MIEKTKEEKMKEVMWFIRKNAQKIKDISADCIRTASFTGENLIDMSDAARDIADTLNIIGEQVTKMEDSKIIKPINFKS